MGQVGTSDGSERDNEWVELGWRMGRSGATRPHFGGGGTFIRRDRYVWSGAAGGKQAASGGVHAAIGIAWLIDRNTEIDYPYAGIALFVRRNCCIRASILLYRRGERRLAGRSFGEEGYVDPACIRIARGE